MFKKICTLLLPGSMNSAHSDYTGKLASASCLPKTRAAQSVELEECAFEAKGSNSELLSHNTPPNGTRTFRSQQFSRGEIKIKMLLFTCQETAPKTAVATRLKNTSCSEIKQK